jgi:hypothetical protein
MTGGIYPRNAHSLLAVVGESSLAFDMSAAAEIVPYMTRATGFRSFGGERAGASFQPAAQQRRTF